MDVREPAAVPVHLGLILDGNRRWARAQGLPLLEGHRVGYKNLHRIALHAVERGVKFVSAYVFSTENWNRTTEEVGYLMDLLVWVARHEVKQYVKDGLKLVFIGSRMHMTARVLKAIAAAEAMTQRNDRGTVVFCLNYGGQTEIAEGVARMIEDGVRAEEVNPARVADYLYYPQLPALDLIVRASGEQRLSNFMLWRAAYAELYFTPVPWPAFTAADLDRALSEFASRQRRYGK